MNWIARFFDRLWNVDRNGHETESRGITGEALWVPPPPASGVTITPDSALGLTAAFACINCLATDLSFPPLQVFKRRGKTDARDIVTDDPRSELLAISPDGYRTTMRFRQAIYAHVFGWGNGFAEIVRNGKGQPESVHILNPSTTKAKREGSGIVYSIQTERGSETLSALDCLHIAGLGPDGLNGYSPVRTVREAFELGKAAELFGATFFGSNALAGGFIKSPIKLKPEAKKNLKESWNEEHQGPYKGHRLAILDAGIEFVKTSIDPDDAQFLETRKFQVLEICRIFRVPPHKVMDLSEAHLANYESASLDYMTTVIAPWAEQIEEEFNLKMFSKTERSSGYFVEHNLKAYMRGDSAARSTFYNVALMAGWMNRDEVRARENLDPIGAEKGGEKFLVQAQMVDLKDAGVAFGVAPADPSKTTTPPADQVVEETPPADPATTVDPGVENVQATALNGAQVTSLQSIVQSVADGLLPPESAKAMLAAAFPAFTKDQIDGMIDPAAGFAPDDQETDQELAPTTDVVEELPAPTTDQELDTTPPDEAP